MPQITTIGSMVLSENRSHGTRAQTSCHTIHSLPSQVPSSSALLH